MENPLIAAETVRKASLSNLRTHEATGSSSVVSTTRRKPAILWNTRDSGLFVFTFFGVLVVAWSLFIKSEPKLSYQKGKIKGKTQA